jgi:lactate dehydrogenase-like 2-hydroxyacid dehydrogenase
MFALDNPFPVLFPALGPMMGNGQVMTGKVDKPGVLQVGSYPDWDQVPLDEAYRIHRYFEAADKPAFLAKVGPGIRAIATRGDLGADRAMIDACPNLEIVVVYGVGYDAVDIAACRQRGIRVTNTPDVLTEDVADLAVGMLLALVRRIPEADRFVRDGKWGAAPFPLTRRMAGMTAGILGLGRIGSAVARRLQAFGMPIAYTARTRKPDLPWSFHPDAATLAAACDVLVVTMAAGAGTSGIVDRRVLDALGPAGLVVNVSRGSVMDEAALLDALQAGRIGGAALDVFLNEPAIDPRFAALGNVVLQPHLGSATIEARQAMGRLVRDNLAAHFAGRPLVTEVA